MTTQHPTQPGWAPQPPLIPPPPRRTWLQGLAIVALAIVGTFFGGMTGSSLVLVNEAAGVIAMLVGLWLGLCLGIVVGFRLTRPAQPSRRRQHGLDQMTRFQR